MLVPPEPDDGFSITIAVDSDVIPYTFHLESISSEGRQSHYQKKKRKGKSILHLHVSDIISMNNNSNHIQNEVVIAVD